MPKSTVERLIYSRIWNKPESPNIFDTDDNDDDINEI
jgi:hypothetical protein